MKTQTQNQINRQCDECGGYELDNGVDDVCECDLYIEDDGAWIHDPDMGAQDERDEA